MTDIDYIMPQMFRHALWVAVGVTVVIAAAVTGNAFSLFSAYSIMVSVNLFYERVMVRIVQLTVAIVRFTMSICEPFTCVNSPTVGTRSRYSTLLPTANSIEQLFNFRLRLATVTGRLEASRKHIRKQLNTSREKLRNGALASMCC